MSVVVDVSLLIALELAIGGARTQERKVGFGSYGHEHDPCSRQGVVRQGHADVELLTMWHLDAEAHFTRPEEGPNQYIEHVRVPAMSIGTYHLPAGGIDDQTPHAEDEVYVVLTGQAHFTSGGDTLAVGPGTTLFVQADEEHRFHDVVQDLAVLVVFAPPYSGPRS